MDTEPRPDVEQEADEDVATDDVPAPADRRGGVPPQHIERAVIEPPERR